MTDKFVNADEYDALRREHTELKQANQRLVRAARDLQTKSYEEGRDDARREHLRAGSRVEQGDGIAGLTLPDNGGAIQFHVVGPMSAKPLTGGLLSPDPDFLLRIWGPPDESGSYGVHEQGGGNLTDFSMSFDLTPEGLVIYRMDVAGVRSRWDTNRPKP